VKGEEHMDKNAAAIIGGCLIISVVILVVGINTAARSLGKDMRQAGRNARASVSVPAVTHHSWDKSIPLKIEISDK
jgi:hypothetical protein